MEVAFFFGPGSRYSYLAASQLDRISADAGAVFRWLPVLSSDLLARTGGVHRSPQDELYRLTDVERWARHYRIPFHDVTGVADWRRWALACVAAQRLGAAETYAKRLYARAFGTGDPPRDGAALAALAADIGLDVKMFARLLDEGATAALYEENLTQALGAGAFGAPTFVTGDGALFWGQDRLPLLVDHLRALSATARTSGT